MSASKNTWRQGMIQFQILVAIPTGNVSKLQLKHLQYAHVELFSNGGMVLDGRSTTFDLFKLLSFWS